MKRGIVLLIVLLLIIPSIFAAERVVVTDNVLTDKIYPGGTAVFELTIRNNQNVADTFLITPDEFAIAPFSDIFRNVEIGNNQVKISAGSQAKIKVNIIMLDDVKPGKNYKTFLRIRSLSNENLKIDYPLTVSVVSPEEVIFITANVPGKVVPGRTLKLNVEFKNRINVILNNVDIYLESELFKKTLNLKKLFPYQEATEIVEFNVHPTTTPGKYTLIITANQDNKLKGSFVKDFEIIKNPNINERIIKDAGFLTSTVNLVKSNNGNLVVNEAFILEIGKFKRLFTTYNKIPDKIQDNNVEWNFELAPGEEFNVTANTDYKALFIFIITFLVFLAIMWYLYGKRVTIRKAVFKVKDDRGGISEIKVLLHVKNRLGNLNDVEIIDIVPSFIKPKHDFGTLAPAKMQRGAKGVRLLWSLPEFLEGEERVISYEIESQLQLLGKLSLPRAKVRYKRKNRIVEVASNKLSFFSTKER
ncbi:hypothetical protein HYX17_03810 [Candidatus Woesearchaeota archaeon]|nr:hypothetical protein [Candidatus Woesearchaeota archaeon]